MEARNFIRDHVNSHHVTREGVRFVFAEHEASKAASKAHNLTQQQAVTVGRKMLSRSVAVAALAGVLPEAAAFVGAPLPVGTAARMGAARSAATRPFHSLRATAAASPAVIPGYGDVSNVELSGLNGKALQDKEFPSVQAVKKAMPEGTWNRDDKVGLRWG